MPTVKRMLSLASKQTMKPTKEEKDISISSTIDEILSQDLPANSPDMDEPDSANQLHKRGKYGAGYRRKKHLLRHIRSKHEGFKYSCNQCEYQATEQGKLKNLKQAIHEGVEYSCDQCEYHATGQGNLKKHRQSIHEGFRYPCNQCEYNSFLSLSLHNYSLLVI